MNCQSLYNITSTINGYIVDEASGVVFLIEPCLTGCEMNRTKSLEIWHILGINYVTRHEQVIIQCHGDQREIVKTVKSVLHRRSVFPPVRASNRDLAQIFRAFYYDRISNIRTIVRIARNGSNMRKVVAKLANVSCQLDPILTKLLKIHKLF